MLFVALLARLVWSVATAEAIPEGIMNATHTPGYLRSDAAVATSERTSNFEERVNLPNINSILEKTQSKINSKLQVWRWRLQQKKTDDVFELLQLDKTDGNNPFRSSVFSQWEKFVRNTQSDGAVTGVIFNTLSRHYSDDASLAEVLVAGTMIETTQYLAHDLLLYQIVQWEEQRKTASDVFALLKLDKTDANPFESPVFSQWEKFVRNTQSDEEVIDVMLKVLSYHYSDDAALAEVLVAGTKIEKMKSIVEKLNSYQFWEWKSQGKTADDVFALLKLNNPNANPFENPVFSQWKNFVKTIYSESAKSRVMLDTLLHHYSNGALGEYLLAASKTDWTKEFAVKLQRANWIDQTFTQMELKQANKNPFENPVFAEWEKFVKTIYWDTLEAVTGVIFNTLSRHYSDDAALAEVLVAGTTIEKTKSIVEDLKLYQAWQWKSQGKTANDVFALLKLDKTGADNLFRSPVISIWFDFALDHGTAGYSVIYSTLLRHYENNDDALVKALIAEMKIAGNDIENVTQILRFRLLKGQLDGDGREGAEKFVGDDKVDLGAFKSFWDHFMGLWGKTSSEIIGEFEKCFSEVKIAVMLATTTAENIFDIPVKELREHQFRLWKSRDDFKTELLKEGISSEKIEEMVGDYARIHEAILPSP